jgi:hypothetical protein
MVLAEYIWAKLLHPLIWHGGGMSKTGGEVELFCGMFGPHQKHDQHQRQDKNQWLFSHLYSLKK